MFGPAALGMTDSKIQSSSGMSRASPLAWKPIDEGLTDELDWFAPTLRPRCQALSAIREGNLDVALDRLADSERWASRSIDRALERSEQALDAQCWLRWAERPSPGCFQQHRATRGVRCISENGAQSAILRSLLQRQK
jgi:hypothetical protein